MWDALLDWDAKACGYLIAHEPYRGPVPASSAAFEAREINAGVRARICVGPSSCRTPRPGSEPDVEAVRNALRDLGYPDAEVRLAKYVGQSPENDVVYGVPLRAEPGCPVAFAHMGRGPPRRPTTGRLTAVRGGGLPGLGWCAGS